LLAAVVRLGAWFEVLAGGWLPGASARCGAGIHGDAPWPPVAPEPVRWLRGLPRMVRPPPLCVGSLSPPHRMG